MEHILHQFVSSMGVANLELGQILMVLISFVLLYLGIKKQFEPLLLVPIAFGIFLTNLPLGGLMNPPGLHGDDINRVAVFCQLLNPQCRKSQHRIIAIGH